VAAATELLFCEDVLAGEGGGQCVGAGGGVVGIADCGWSGGNGGEGGGRGEVRRGGSGSGVSIVERRHLRLEGDDVVERIKGRR